MKNMLRLLVGEGFRVFFLAAGVCAVLSIAVWLCYWGGLSGLWHAFDLPIAMAPTQWHAHELIFGFGAAALGGFFLTAVPNWTGAKSAPHRYIAMVSGLWLLGRFAVWFSLYLPPTFVAVVDLSFAPFLGVKIAMQLTRKPKPQNMIFLLFLTYFWIANIMIHLEWTGVIQAGVDSGLRGGLMALVGMIIILGGRVTPAFTRNAMNRAGIEDGQPHEPKFFTPIAIFLAATLPLVSLLDVADRYVGVIYGLAGIFVVLRVTRWHAPFQWTQPILATLHVSYAIIGLGLLVLSSANFGLMSEVAALHLLAIGGVGGMTLSIMSRATLGHTGRGLIAPKIVAISYGIIPFAALVRWLGGEIGGEIYLAAVMVSGVLWIGAFSAFVGAFFPIWTTPRPPRAPVGPPPAQ